MDKNNINELLNCQGDEKKIDSFVDKNLSQNQKNQLMNILSDKEQLRKVLESDKAKELMKKIMKD